MTPAETSGSLRSAKGLHSPDRQHSQAMDLSSLPVEVIAAILAHVPIKDRLSACALVCTTWAAAGAAASKALHVQLRDQGQADNLGAWLAQHGSSIEHLSICSDQQVYQHALLQWHKQQRRGVVCGNDVVVTPAVESADEPPCPPRFNLRLPLLELYALRRLSIEHVRLQPFHAAGHAASTARAGKTAPGTVSSTSDNAPGVDVDSCGKATAGDSSTSSLQHSVPSHLAHLHMDSSFMHLPDLLASSPDFLSGLQTLKLTEGTEGYIIALLYRSAADAAFSELCRLCVRLQKLLLCTSLLTPAGLQSLTCLSKLQHAELHVPGGSARRPVSVTTWLQHLPVDHLSHLVLRPLARADADKTLDLSSSSLSALSHFSHLQHLTITYGVHLDPRSLSHLLHLTHLQLSDIDLAKTDPQDDSKPLGSAAMLDAVSCLQELQVLQLSPGLLPTPHAPVERYSALTASSHLTFLSLYHCQLPAGAAAAMFPCGRLLPGLRSLRMPQPPAGQQPCSAEILNGRSPFLSGQAASILRAARDNSGTSSSSAMPSGGLPFGPGSIASLASCCPNLQQLWLTAAVAADVDLTPLQHLTGLTELQLGGPVVDDAVSERLLCGLTQLQRLDLLQCPRFTDAGLVFLTALRQLTSLQVKDAGLSYCAAGDGVGHMLYMVRRQEGSSCCTPVYERLHQQCLNSRDCLLVMLRQRDQQLAAATAALAKAEARAAAAEAKAAAAGVAGQ